MTGFTTARPVAHDRVERWDLETDVAIVGFGAAGACAAIEAAEAGAAVTLFEAASGSGGASALSGGEIYLGGGGGTDAQRAAGFADSTEALETYLMMAGGPDADAANVALYARESLAHYQWLKDQGIPYKGTFLPGKIIEPAEDDTLIWSGSEAAWPFSDAPEADRRPDLTTSRPLGDGR